MSVVSATFFRTWRTVNPQVKYRPYVWSSFMYTYWVTGLRISTNIAQPSKTFFSPVLNRSSAMTRRGIIRCRWLRDRGSRSIKGRDWRFYCPQRVTVKRSNSDIVQNPEKTCISHHERFSWKRFDGATKSDDDSLKRWRENSTKVLNRITSGEVPLWKRTDPPRTREIISAIKTDKRSKVAQRKAPVLSVTIGGALRAPCRCKDNRIVF